MLSSKKDKVKHICNVVYFLLIHFDLAHCQDKHIFVLCAHISFFFSYVMIISLNRFIGNKSDWQKAKIHFFNSNLPSGYSFVTYSSLLAFHMFGYRIYDNNTFKQHKTSSLSAFCCY